MTLAELLNILKATGYPVAYSHFTTAQMPPYICILVDASSNMMADNKVYHEINDINIELYTLKKDLVAEAKLKNVLDEHEMPYDSPFETFIESEKLYQKFYEVRLI
ncbi:hypothetical protein [Bacillus multifaciens]|uniref:hypothetical protein n=1 Tax=Bacillus multifaciens TaxID=3068506 RepID=UPI002742045B|nr:hypothetical protein [Bacillus sp. WLY-B-L8]MDP7981523.1 hypothetical protein [Bacillus sp. WLY-B-L8]